VADRVVTMTCQRPLPHAGNKHRRLRQSDGTLGYSPNLKHGVNGKGLKRLRRDLLYPQGRGLPWLVSIEDGMNGMDEMKESIDFLKRMRDKHFCG